MELSSESRGRCWDAKVVCAGKECNVNSYCSLDSLCAQLGERWWSWWTVPALTGLACWEKLDNSQQTEGGKCAVSFRNGMCFKETSWLKRWLVSGAGGGAFDLRSQWWEALGRFGGKVFLTRYSLGKCLLAVKWTSEWDVERRRPFLGSFSAVSWVQPIIRLWGLLQSVEMNFRGWVVHPFNPRPPRICSTSGIGHLWWWWFRYLKGKESSNSTYLQLFSTESDFHSR